MGFMERIGGAEGVKVVIGSGFFWAWLDGLFMSAFFLTDQSQGFMSELAFVVVFACTVPASLWALMRRTQFSAALANKRFMVGMALAGSLGSFFFIGAGVLDNLALLLVGGLLGGFFMSVFAAAWGACYCARGAERHALCDRIFCVCASCGYSSSAYGSASIFGVLCRFAAWDL